MERCGKKRFLLLVVMLTGAMIAGRSRAAELRAGAAVGDMTPPAFNPASHTPVLDPPGYDGPRQWDFSEPYKDLNGNGHWDPGEPYVDENNNGRYDGIYLGGGTGRIGQPPTKAADPITARAFVIDNGTKVIAVEVLDVIGMFNTDMDRIRALVRAKLGPNAIDEIFISSTHDESAPDVIGLWGPGIDSAIAQGQPANSGVDDYWMNFAENRAAQAIADAYNSREPAVLKFAETEQPKDFLTCWSSYPFVRASKILVMQAVSTQGHHTIFTLGNYGIHAESLSFNPDPVQKYWLSADWIYWERAALEAHYGGVAIEMAGAVGSVETPEVFANGSVSRTPTGEYDAHHPAGCRTIFATQGTPVPLGYYDETRAIGEGVANQVIGALNASPRVYPAVALSFQRVSFLAPISNGDFVLAAFFGVFPHRQLYLNGQPAPAVVQVSSDPASGLPPENEFLSYEVSPLESGFQFKTELVTYTIGPAQFISSPGEEFPVGYIRGFQGPDQMPNPSEPVADFVSAHMDGQYRFIEGLGEDMLGYLFPQANAVGIPTIEEVLGGVNVSDVDQFGCNHSDDSEATDPTTGDVVASEAASLLETTGAPQSSNDTIAAGRYIWPDFTFHRDPLGEGTLGCSDGYASFTPAPGPAAGVLVQGPNGLQTILMPGVGTRMAGAVRALGFIDYNGAFQGPNPTVDTRGVELPGGRKIFVDVYPDMSNLTQ